MNPERTESPIVLSIAGFDPSGGAGVLRDARTCFDLGAHSIAAVTAITYQNERSFFGLKWLSTEEVLAQLDPLRDLRPDAVKVGLVQNLSSLRAVLEYVREWVEEAPVVWDPVLSASAGFEFHPELHARTLAAVLQRVTVITPNREEAIRLRAALGEPDSDGEDHLARYCSVYETNGAPDQEWIEERLRTGREEILYRTLAIAGATRHGTGCVFSSAIAALLARGEPLERACTGAGAHTRRFLTEPAAGKSIVEEIRP